MKKDKILKMIDEGIASGPFENSWDSLENYKVPDWYVNGKFGILLHWGVYSVPAFGNEWYPRNMYVEGSPEFKHHLATYGPQDKFGYKDFIPMFKGEKFNAEEWASLFKRAGARFVVPVAEHHDGFQMYKSDISKWNSAEMGPKVDFLGELSKAVRKFGMIFGINHNRAEHYWYFGQGRKFPSDVQDPEYEDFYGPAHPDHDKGENYFDSSPDTKYLEDWLARISEIVHRYQPQIIFFDWWIMNLAFKPYLKKFAAYYYNTGLKWNKGVVINSKYDAFPAGTSVLDIDRGQVSKIRMLPWQTDTSISKNSWGYIKDQDYKSIENIICDLVDIVSKNGNMLLNVCPRSDGTIVEQEQKALIDIGEWLSTNGDAIYGTRPWKIFGEGPTKVLEGSFTDINRNNFTSEDIRFTTKDGNLYAIILKWPDSGEITIKSLGSDSQHRIPNILNIELLGSSSNLNWRISEQGLFIDTTLCIPVKYLPVFKITTAK